MLIFGKGHKNSKTIKNTKNSKLFQDDLIVCNEDRNIIETMKKGYQEMAKINLQLAMDNECELMEVKEYETWLCGV